MTQPRILVSTSTKPRREGLERLDVIGGLNYAEALVRFGALPLFVPNVAAELAPRLLEGADGLLLAGGEDVDPERFGAAPARGLGRVDPARDAMEIALYREARARGLPVLGICRGIQLINVAEGGDLHQHLPDVDDTQQHEQVDITGTPLHPVTLARDSKVARAYGAERIRANSYHHQAVRRLGAGLRATGHADDGVVEALEGDGAFLLAVQWHPEMSFTRHPEHLAPFQAFVEAARDALRAAPRAAAR